MQNLHFEKRSVYVENITYHSLDNSVVKHCLLDHPSKNSISSKQVLHIKGWVFPTRNIECVQLSCGHHTLDRDLDLSFRPDVAAHFEDDEAHCGFEFYCNIYTILDILPLKIQAVFHDGSVVPLTDITFSIKRKKNKKNKGIKPCLLLSMDRSGSTFLANLLGKQPEVVVYPQYPFEAWAVHYWMRTLLNLTSPLDVETPGDSRSWSSKLDNFVSFHNRSLFGSYQQNNETLEWLYDIYPEQTAKFSHGSIISFYNEVSKIKGPKKHHYFIEKVRPTIESLLFLNHRPETKQIVLIRDFRDYTCSYLSFFGLEPYASEQEMIIKKICPTIWRLYECYLAFQERSLLVRYEELVEAPQVVLQKILDYLEIKSSAKLIKRMCELTKADKKGVEKKHVTAKSTTKSIGRWKIDLAPELVAVLEDNIKEPMAFFDSIEK